MVRVLNAGTVDKARPQADRLLAVLKHAQAEGCYIYVAAVWRDRCLPLIS
jgi:hypothetical protein